MNWPRLLVAYADGELGPAERALVERRLERDPGARQLLDDLRRTGPANPELWMLAEPDWSRIRLGPPKRNRRPASALVVIAAAVVLAWGLWPTVKPNEVAMVEPAPEVDPLAEYAELPIATPADVMIAAIKGDGDVLVSVSPPLNGGLALATPDDIEIEDAGGGQADPDGAAMIWQPKK